MMDKVKKYGKKVSEYVFDGKTCVSYVYEGLLYKFIDDEYVLIYGDGKHVKKERM